MRRSRPLVVVAGLLVAGLVMLSWTQTWFSLKLDASSSVESTVAASGSTAVSAYTALAIASLALFLALTIAGRILRIVLGVIQVLLGVVIVAQGIEALADPVRASASAVTTVTGIQDVAGVRHIVASVTVEFWPYLGVAGGFLAALLGVVVIVVQRRWPGPSRKYGDATRRPGAAPVEIPRDAVFDWDDLSAGVDPTDAAVPTGVETTAAAARPVERSDARPAESQPVGLNHSPTGGAADDKEHREQH
jgi:uncharacterized membrane protein (TIGR02234 family)